MTTRYVTMTERESYRAAWAAWEEAPEDMKPSWATRADLDRSPVSAQTAGGAESGPRRAPSVADGWASLARAIELELEAAVAMPHTAARLGDMLATVRERASWAGMMNHETTPAIARMRDVRDVTGCASIARNDSARGLMTGQWEAATEAGAVMAPEQAARALRMFCRPRAGGIIPEAQRAANRTAPSQRPTAVEARTVEARALAARAITEGWPDVRTGWAALAAAEGRTVRRTPLVVRWAQDLVDASHEA